VNALPASGTLLTSPPAAGTNFRSPSSRGMGQPTATAAAATGRRSCCASASLQSLPLAPGSSSSPATALTRETMLLLLLAATSPTTTTGLKMTQQQGKIIEDSNRVRKLQRLSMKTTMTDWHTDSCRDSTFTTSKVGPKLGGGAFLVSC
jgi:hypothetical protein